MSRFPFRLGAAALIFFTLAPAAMADCEHPKGWKPSIEKLKRQEAAYLAPAPPGWAENGAPNPSACNANLSGKDLRGIVLHGADLRDANLSGSDLSAAQLSLADLTGAHLVGAKAIGINLALAHMSRADLRGANLENAELVGTDLVGANLGGTNLAGAVLDGTDFTDAYYEPRGGPPARVSQLIGLESVRFRDGSGVAQLRQVARESGQRDVERAATFAIEHERTRKLGGDYLDEWLGHRPYLPMLEGLFRRVAFEWTTGYGLYPGRALQIILMILALLIPLYAWVASRARPTRSKTGIYRILPADRIEVADGKASASNPVTVERLSLPVRPAIAWGAYFSLLSAFNIGFRDLNVGSWISRAQPSRFQLDSLGWVRTVSGLQSLLSLYLLAMWLVTYFGRPFD